MSKVAVIGPEEFVLGFQLAGIKDIKIVQQNELVIADSSSGAMHRQIDTMDRIREVMHNSEIGVIIIDENIVNSLDFNDRKDIENSISPVFVQLSTKASQDSLRKLIKKSIGVDLWGMERG